MGYDDEPKLEETVANWSPVFDFDLINPAAQGHAQSRAMRDRMYACTGRGEHGAIAEIRCGIQGLIQSSAEYHPGIRNIWVLPNLEGSGLLVLCSFPDRSTLCFLSERAEWENVSECEFPDMYQTTIAAAAVGGRAVQVTPKAVNVQLLKEESLNRRGAPSGDIAMLDGDLEGETNGDSDWGKGMWSQQCGPRDHIIAAVIQDVYLVVVVKTEDNIRMTLATILPVMAAE